MLQRRPLPLEPDVETKTVGDAAGSTAPPGFALLISSAAGVSLVSLGDSEKVVLGRAPECDVCVNDESVSRKHAMLRLRGQLSIEDLDSHNGTTVMGRRARAGECLPVAIGSVIELGAVTVLVQSAREIAGYMRGARRVDAPPLPAARANADAPVLVDPTMQRLFGMLDVIAPTPLAVMILGETGTGKEVYATALHARSTRASGPFLKLNCAALPDSILEGELFGYERGAFTGATQAKAGLLESADGGTVFLDEIGEMPMTTQAKLLRVLESGEVFRLGALKPKVIDVRLVSATNRDPRRLIADGRFRSDLYFRINGISMTLPPLRKRRGEILPLAQRFLVSTAAMLGRTPPEMTEAAARALEAYQWPGNVRELRNVIERAAVLCGDGALDDGHLQLAEEDEASAAETSESTGATTSVPPPSREEPPPAEVGAPLRDQMGSFERRQIVEALTKVNGNQSRAAELLGVSRRTLINKIEAYGIERPRKGKKESS